jgi:hypothetical protein
MAPLTFTSSVERAKQDVGHLAAQDLMAGNLQTALWSQSCNRQRSALQVARRLQVSPPGWGCAFRLRCQVILEVVRASSLIVVGCSGAGIALRQARSASGDGWCLGCLSHSMVFWSKMWSYQNPLGETVQVVLNSGSVSAQGSMP